MANSEVILNANDRRICSEWADLLDFDYVRDHVFSSSDIEEEMQKDYQKVCLKAKSPDSSVAPEFLINELVEDDPWNIGVIPTDKVFGIVAARDFKKEEIVGMYFGEVTLSEERDENSDFVLHIPGTRFSVNSEYKGNLLRYIIQSCRPNCRWETRWFNGKCYPILVTNQDIQAGTWLTSYSKLDIKKEAVNFKCLCGDGDNVCRALFVKKATICGLRYENIGGKLVMTNNVCKEPLTPYKMYEHRFGHHYAGGKVICQLCLKSGKERVYNTLASLTVHLNRSHAKKDKNKWRARSIKYPCSYCNKWKFLSPTKWQDHLLKCMAEPGLHNQEDDAENPTWEDFESAAVIDQEEMAHTGSANKSKDEKVSDIENEDDVVNSSKVILSSDDAVENMAETEDDECDMEIDEGDEENENIIQEDLEKQNQAGDEAQQSAIKEPEVGINDNTTLTSEPDFPCPSTSKNEQKSQECELSFGNRRKRKPETDTRTEIQDGRNKMKKTSEKEDSLLEGFVVKEEENSANESEDEGFIRIVNVYHVGAANSMLLSNNQMEKVVEENNDGSEMEIDKGSKEMENTADQNEEGDKAESIGVEQPELEAAMDYNTILSEPERPSHSTPSDERISRGGLSSESSIDRDFRTGMEIEQSQLQPADGMEQQFDKSLSWIIDTWTLDHSQLNKDTLIGNAVVDILAGGVPADKEKLLITDFAKQTQDAVGPFLSLLIVSTLTHYLNVKEMLRLYEATKNSNASKEMKELVLLFVKLKWDARNQSISWPIEIYAKVLETLYISTTGSFLDMQCSKEKRSKLWGRLFCYWQSNNGVINTQLLRKSAKLTCNLGAGHDCIKVTAKCGANADSEMLYVHRHLAELAAGKTMDCDFNVKCKNYESVELFLDLIYDEYSVEKLKLTDDFIDMLLSLPLSLKGKRRFLFRKNNLEDYFKPGQKSLLFKSIVKLELVCDYKQFVESTLDKIIDCELPNMLKTLDKPDLIYLLEDKNINLGAMKKYKCVILWCTAEDNQVFEDIVAGEESLKKYESVKQLIDPHLKQLMPLQGILFNQGFVDLKFLL